MRSSQTLIARLGSDLEPSRNTYVEIAKHVTNDPSQISNLVQDERKEETLLYLIEHSGRLTRLFRCIHDRQEVPLNREHGKRTVPPRNLTKDAIASAILIFCLELLPSVSGILEDAQVIELLVSALENCLPAQSPSLQKLAKVLADNDGFLEQLASDDSGGEILRRWISLPVIATQDANTLETWARRLVDLASSCKGNHGIDHEIQRWKTLVELKKAFYAAQEDMEQDSKKRAQRLPQNLLVSSTHMITLDPHNKKSYIASGRKRPEAYIIKIDEVFHGPIREFGLHIPSTRGELQQAICTLEGTATISILDAVARTYPCRLCKEALSLVASGINANAASKTDKSLSAGQPLETDIFGKSIGIWKILLSHQAIKSLQGLSRSGDIGPTEKKLRNLASGEWRQPPPLAGSEDQKKELRLPLVYTICTQHTFILWQIDVGIVDATRTLHQVIKVWEVGDPDAISKSIDRVATLQRTYNHDLVQQCTHLPNLLYGKNFPIHFKSPVQDIAKSPHGFTDLDVRIIDQETIDMGNKFYPLTEPVMRSIIANDLNAEFPVDVSQDEIQIIYQVETSSLVLGRSGTGKTTCLVYKLVGKHLARRSLPDERRLRQILLTRSNFLADRLRVYGCKLIEGISSETLKIKAAQEEDALGSSTADLRTTASALDLDDSNFPLICTFEEFLELLENTVRVMNRQDFNGLRAHPIDNTRIAKSATKKPKGQFVDSQAFRLDYWPRLPHLITNHISVDLVFAEIMGVIKGSTSSRDSLEPLSRKDYLTRSSRLAPNFQTESERSCVYEAFQAYEALKIASEDHDHVDRVVKLLKAIRGDLQLQRILTSTFDEVYIDEVQDQRPLDFELLFSFVKDSRGFHFAGDTAQAISQDSTFQFPDIKQLFHTHFAATSAAANQKHMAAIKEFSLSKNYRSHQGILALASFVMALLWKGFPQMIDKLEPEVGHLIGPQPVLFIGCDTDTLISCNAGKVKFSERSADFGADQVILVRDAKAKTILQDQIGKIALVLTILQAKGMEFDDVILWDFFSGSPSLGGVRSLNALAKDDRNAFDSNKNWGMCSELKHLYVAITRARIQLFLFESDETAVKSVIKLLTQDVPEPLVEITRPNDANFAANIKSLRPGTSNDPQRWSFKGEQLMQQGNYKDALLCFEKACDHRGAVMAKAKLHEENGRVCFAQENTEGFRQNFQEAVALYLEIDLIGDASRTLVKMGDVERAAELWVQNGKYERAAPLFEQSSLYEKAAKYYHLDKSFIEAAAALRKGNKFDLLISYLSSNYEHIPPHVQNTYSRLYKVLLKQGKVSYEHRKDAINILGSLAEQESYFIEYEMYNDLAEFYEKQQRHEDHFNLLIKFRRLEEALNVWVEQQLSDCPIVISEKKVLKILDYVYAGKRTSGLSESDATTIFHNPDKIDLLKIEQRFEEWVTISQINAQGLTSLHDNKLKSSDLRAFFSVQSILDTTLINRASDFDSLPFELLEDAVKFMKDIVIRNDSQAKKIVLLLTGVWQTHDLEKPFVLLPWSPLNETITDVSAADLAQIATQWVLDRLASTVLVLDSKSWELFKHKYPQPCSQFVLKGFCHKKRNGEDCFQPHERISTDYFATNLEDLRRVTAIFCNLTVLHFRRVLVEDFQREFLPIRRRWLERFLRQLIFVSPAEQDASIISKIQAEELRREKISAIGPCIENLLYHRLGKEWEQRKTFSSLLEQMQLAKTFGENVHARFFRALSFKLFYISKRSLMREHLRLLNWLENSCEVVDAEVYQQRLNSFLFDLERLDNNELSSMHAVTAIVEKLALILILKFSSRTPMVPQAWIDLYVPQLRLSVAWVRPLAGETKHKYRECLLRLIQSFAQLLDNWDSEFKQDFCFSLGGKPYRSALLQQRNVECLAVGLVNLPASHSENVDTRDFANKVFGSLSVRADHLKYHKQDEREKILANSLAEYEGKNPLVIISEDSQQINRFPKRAGVKIRSMNDILALMKRNTVSEVTIGKSPSDLNTDENYTPAEIEAICRIQKFWRSRIPKLKQHREYMQSPEAKAIEYFIALSSHRPTPVVIKALLVTSGVALYLKFPKLRESIAEQHKAIMSSIMKTEIPDQLGETLDEALRLNGQSNEKLKTAMDHMSEERLEALLASQESLRDTLDLAIQESLRDTFDFVEKALGEIERGIHGVSNMIEEVSAHGS